MIPRRIDRQSGHAIFVPAADGRVSRAGGGRAIVLFNKIRGSV